MVAIIPARGGSKRIPGKNIKLFCGKPMIVYSVEAARESGLFDRIIVSTDSTEIASVARECGAEVPFMRPPELSDDKASTDQVLQHVLKRLMEAGERVEQLCCIYATAPFIRAEYLREGQGLLRQRKATACFSVTTFPFPIFRSLKITDNGMLEMFWPEHRTTRSQELPEAYHDAGQFYWLDAAKYLEEGRLYSREAVPVVIPRYLVQDIDTMEDWETAERMFAAQLPRMNAGRETPR